MALTAVLVAGLSGCVAGGNGGQPSSTPSDAPAPVSAIDERCDGLVAPEVSQVIWDGELESVQYTSHGVRSTTTMGATALVQSEALICSWTQETGAPAALLIAMGDSADGFTRSEPTFAEDSPYNGGPHPRRRLHRLPR